MPDNQTTDNHTKTFCRSCGGERRHKVISQHSKRYSEEEDGVFGDETWSIVECAGCETITFLHDQWFPPENNSEQTRKIYPPAPSRKKPEWGFRLMLALPRSDFWIMKLHEDIYEALGLEAYSLAAMGSRSIIDSIITSKAGDQGSFPDKLDKLTGTLISQLENDSLRVAFDAGSAAAHRGYNPSRNDSFLLLDLAEWQAPER